MLESALIAALNASVPYAVAGGLVIKALNSEPAKALYLQVAVYLGPWHERRALMIKSDSIYSAIERLRQNQVLTDPERRLLETAVFGCAAETPVHEALDRAEDRAMERIRREATIEQENMEAIVASCLDQVAGSGEVVRTVDPQWFSDFFDACRNVNNMEIREMWATILTLQTTGEGNLSKRALEALRLFDRRDGEVLQAIARWTIRFGDKEAMPITPIRPLMQDDDLKRAQTIGIVGEIEELIFAMRGKDHVETLRLSDGSEIVLTWTRGVLDPPKPFLAWVSPLGKELLTIVDREPDVNFLRSLGQMFKGFGVTTHHARPEFDAALNDD